MRRISNAILWISIAIVPFSFWLAAVIGHQQIYGLAGMMRYLWIMWCMIPIGVGSIMIGLKLKTKGEKYKGNIVSGIVSIFFLLLIGSYSFTSGSLYDNEALQPISDISGISFPKDTKAAESDYVDYKFCVATIDASEMASFETQLRSSGKWTEQLDPVVKNLMPDMVRHYFGDEGSPFELFLFRNLNSGEYNTSPPLFSKTPCVFIAYDCDTGRILAISDFVVNFS